MKVYVMTKFKALGLEEFVDIAKSEKEAISKFRAIFPHMRGTVKENNLSSDASNTYLLRVIEKEM